MSPLSLKRHRKNPRLKRRPNRLSPVLKKKPAAHIGHTVMPTKNEITCYQCEYEFKFTGRIAKIHCPKCKAELDLTDHTIDTVWTKSIKTAGKIYVTSKGVIKGGALSALDIMLDGKIEGGMVQAYRYIELGPNAVFSIANIKGRDLRIASFARINLETKRVIGMLIFRAN